MKNILTATTLLFFFILTASSDAVELKSNPFDLDIQKVRYEYASTGNDANGEIAFFSADKENGENEFQNDSFKPKHRSPLKAFLLSLAVPGLGQFYNGSKVKAIGFIGAEVAFWSFNRKWNSQGDDQAEFFEAFNREHWSRTDYEDVYLQGVYGVNDDDLAVQYQNEISHHLPDEESQQYFEMTGKYGQFAWGWDDAAFANGDSLQSLFPLDSTNAITGQSSTPFSANREFYENLRDEANNTYSKANNMIALAMINRVISSLEAFVSARNHNKAAGDSFGEFSGVKVRPTMKSMYSVMDTPYLKLSLRF